MADTRINALTTSTVSLSDDFFPIDGTTAGTKKLSAFSPSFGGNVTVGGLLTVNTGANIASGDGLSLQTAGSASVRFQDAGVSKWWIYKLSGDQNLYFRDMVNSRMQMLMQPGVTSSAASTTLYSSVAIDSTTASLNSSSGALVVGGGLGVVGAINAGATITTTEFGYAGGLSSNSLNFTRNSFNYVNLAGGTSASLNFNATTTTPNDTSVFSYNNTRVAILTGTASNNTSSGALQVTGGVGVSGAIYANAVNALTSVKVANTSQSVPAYGDVGPQLSVAGAVITDTSSSGTVSRAVVNSIAASALAASSTTTYTQAASLFVAGAPTANTNVTITHGYALYTAGGRINFQGLPTSSAGLQAGTLWNDAGTLKVA